MGKADQNAAKKSTQQQMQQNQQNETQANTTLQGVLGTAQSTAGSVLPGITAGYSDISTTGGGLDPTSTEAYKKLALTGGISDEDTQAMRDTASEAARSTYTTGAERAK